MNSGLETSASLLAVLNCASKLNRMIILIVYAIVNWVARVFSQPQEYLYVIKNLKISMSQYRR